MRATLKYLKTVLTHKWYVFVACARCGYPIAGLAHDNSKLSKEEFGPYRDYFAGSGQNKSAFDKAWVHHKACNKHHPEGWFKHPMAFEYAIEMFCDWIGAGKVYSKEKWDCSEPVRFFAKNNVDQKLHPITATLAMQLGRMLAFKKQRRFFKIFRKNRHVIKQRYEYLIEHEPDSESARKDFGAFLEDLFMD